MREYLTWLIIGIITITLCTAIASFLVPRVAEPMKYIAVFLITVDITLGWVPYYFRR